VLSLDMV